MCVLPVQCKRCGAMFDLWYDLQEMERRSDDFPGSRVSQKVLRDSLCWNCRNVFMKKLRDGRKEEMEAVDELMFELE